MLRDLAAVLADGGDCLSDLACLRDQPGLFGPVASTPTAWRVVSAPPATPTGWPGCVRAARAHAAPAPGPSVATRTWSCWWWTPTRPWCWPTATPKQGAAGTYERTFGFAPLLAYLDRGQAPGESLAGILRPGNASDLVELVDLAVAQLPTTDLPVLVRPES